MSRLAAVLRVDETRCVSCHACIAACPVKLCNDGSGEVVHIDHDLCIGCGRCISACKHGARLGVDDTEAFLRDCRARVPTVAIVAPAVAAVFPRQHLKLNGWLRSLGVAAVFDVSFGAELTVRSYLDYMDRAHPRTVVAQPCPALVSFAEIWEPRLLPYLAPADSPMAHTMKMVRRFYPQYASHRIAVLSPCYAKKREFEAIGLGDYNVTFKAVRDQLERERIDLGRFDEVDYDNPPAERAVLFSSPGGLLRTAERARPGVGQVTRKIEGAEAVYPYLRQLPAMIDRGLAPALVDCLSCGHGCNGGPATGNAHLCPDELEHWVEERRAQMEQRYLAQQPVGGDRERWLAEQLDRVVDTRWEPNLYARTYQDRSRDTGLRKLSPAELEQVFRTMEKHGQRDVLDCRACGYESCADMAEAIANGVNKPENCARFRETKLKAMQLRDGQLVEIQQAAEQLAAASQQLDALARAFSDNAEHSSRQAAGFTQASSAIAGRVREVDEATGQFDAGVREIAAGASAVSTAVAQALQATREGQQAVDKLGRSSAEAGNVIKLITSIAAQTKLLALNATIEAVRAGDAGRGFAVVANEVKELAKQAATAADQVSERIEGIKGDGRATTEKLQRIAAAVGDVVATKERISAAVDRQARLIGDVRSRVAQVSGTTREMTEESGRAARTAEETKANGAQVRAAAHELARVAQSLLAMVSRFRSGSDAAPGPGAPLAAGKESNSARA